MMTVPVVTPSGSYVSDGSLTARAIPFPFMSPAFIVVTVDGVARVLHTHYEISGVYPSATLVPLTGFATNGQTVRFRRQTPAAQDYAVSGNEINAKALERSLDREAMFSQEILDQNQRSLLVPVGETAPPVASLADANGKVLAIIGGVVTPIANDPAGVEDGAERAEAAAAAAVAAKTLAETAQANSSASAAAASDDADRAELAADAAALAAGIYANEAAGRAAVADGVRFVAVGATTDKAVDIWQRVNSGSSTLLRSYPSLDALNAAIAAMASVYATGRLSDDGFVGARAASVLPPAQAATVSGNTFPITTGGANLPIVLTGDEVGDTTSIATAIVEIISGSAGTAFSVALGRWYNSVGVQIGADVALAKTATKISLAAGSTQPVGARSLTFFLTPPATTVVRRMNYQLGTPARPTTDAWYLSLLGAGIGQSNPAPVDFIGSGANWNPITGRVTVPATAGGQIYLSVPSGVNDGDTLWVFFDSAIEPTTWLQTVNPRFGDSGGGSGNGYRSQILHVGGNRFAVALNVQSAADGAFFGPGWTWNNTGAATYFDNIKLYVGPKPPFVEPVSAIILKGIRDEIDSARIKPLITLADDSCGISSNQFQPSPGKSLSKFFGSGTKFQNMSTPGNNLAQSASTVGLLPIHVSVSGGVIPASTAPVSITSWDQDPITSNGPFNPEYDPYAYLCGVLGRISAGGFSGVTPTSLVFTPIVAPAWPIDVPAGSKLILRASRRRKGGLTLFPLSSVNGIGGGGNSGSPFASAVALADAIFAANDPATIAGFIGLTPNPYDTGASLLAAFVGKSYYSRLYNPNIMSAATVAEAMSLFGWTWATGENAAWLAGSIGIPGSMRIPADTFHPYKDESAYVLSKNHSISAPVTAFLENYA